MTTEAQKKAMRKYDGKRPAPIAVRMSQNELDRLDAVMRDGEARAAGLKRRAAHFDASLAMLKRVLVLMEMDGSLIVGDIKALIKRMEN